MTPEDIERLFKSNNSLYDFAAAIEAATIEHVVRVVQNIGATPEQRKFKDEALAQIRALAKEKS